MVNRGYEYCKGTRDKEAMTMCHIRYYRTVTVFVYYLTDLSLCIPLHIRGLCIGMLNPNHLTEMMILAFMSSLFRVTFVQVYISCSER